MGFDLRLESLWTVLIEDVPTQLRQMALLPDGEDSWDGDALVEVHKLLE